MKRKNVALQGVGMHMNKQVSEVKSDNKLSHVLILVFQGECQCGARIGSVIREEL